LLGITKSGGDLKNYLEETAKHEQEVRRRELVDIVNKLNMAAELSSTSVEALGECHSICLQIISQLRRALLNQKSAVFKQNLCYIYASANLPVKKF
jgi:hypothetical protein